MRRQLSWIQITLAVAVIMTETGFLLMYCCGWSRGTGNLLTVVIIKIILVGLGVTYRARGRENLDAQSNPSMGRRRYSEIGRNIFC